MNIEFRAEKFQHKRLEKGSAQGERRHAPCDFESSSKTGITTAAFKDFDWPRASAILVVALVILTIVKLHLLILLLATCSGFALVRALPQTRLLQLVGNKAGLVSSYFVLIGPLAGIVGGAFALRHFVKQASAASTRIAQDLGLMLDRWRTSLPQLVLDHLPSTADGMHPWIIEMLKRQSENFTAIGKSGATGLLLALAGLVIGVLIANDRRPASTGLLSTILRARVTVFQSTFVDVVVSQVWIAAINTSLTAVFFFVILPAAGWHMPFASLLLTLTFVAGMLPVVGNLLCNTVTTAAALTVSPTVAASALAFLVVIHKLEYFINAKVVGSRTSLATWELLLAILVMEFAFGAPGLVVAPLFYAYLKRELVAARLV